MKSVPIGLMFDHTCLKYKSMTKSYNNFKVAKDVQVEPHFDYSYVALD